MATWMVLEDEPDLYDMIMAMYEMLGVEGVAFGAGEEAVDWIEDVENGHWEEELPELALLDIRMPDSISGLMVGERMRQSARLKNTVIVLMTAHKLSPSEEKEAIQQTDADLLMYKPLPGFAELERTFHDLIRNSTRKNGNGATSRRRRNNRRRRN
jgi:CheY-like chemotaxis protein